MTNLSQMVSKETLQNDGRILLTNGDSWTFGSEIMAPEFLADQDEIGYGMANRYKKGCNDWEPYNDYYRIPRIWPTFLAKSINFKNINLARPARSNDTIYNTTIGWLLENYVIPKKDTSNLLVVVGWSSPERKNVIINDADSVYLQTFWPAMTETKFYISKTVSEYFKFYVKNLWVEQEYIARYIEQNYMLSLFCKSHGINYCCFNGFYLTPGKNPSKWNDLNIEKILESWNSVKISGWFDPEFQWQNEVKRLQDLWSLIDDDTFILKDKDPGSFKSYIYGVSEEKNIMINWHPSPEGHRLWASFLKSRLEKIHPMLLTKLPQKRFSSMIKNG